MNKMQTLSGLEQLNAMLDGTIPPAPVSDMIGMEGFSATYGTAEVSLEPRLMHYNPLGAVHGGVLATLLDTAAACAVHSTLEPGEAYTSMDLSVKFLRPVTVESGRLRATGRIIQRGRRTALAEAEIVDGSGRRVAHATSSCMIFPAS